MVYIYAEHIGEGTYLAQVALDDEGTHEGRGFISDGKHNALSGLIGMLRSLGYSGRIIGNGVRD